VLWRFLWRRVLLAEQSTSRHGAAGHEDTIFASRRAVSHYWPPAKEEQCHTIIITMQARHPLVVRCTR